MLRADAESSTGRSAGALTREGVEAAAPLRTLSGRNVSKADLRVVRVGGRTVAVKDYRARPFLVRNTVGRLLVGRECRAYAAADGLDGLAPFLGRVDAFALATAWIDATPLSALAGTSLPGEALERVAAIVEALHARGVAVGDLHHRDILIASDGAVHLVDLATAVVLGPRPTRWRRGLFERMRAQDRLAVARIAARFAGRPDAEALRGVDPAAVRRYTAGRRVKALWDALRRKRG